MNTKKLIILLSFLGISQTKAQTYVLIPDNNFATYLQGLIPGAMNANSLNITSTLVTIATHSISVASHSISNLSGVQYFSSLTFLDCSSNSLSTLPALPNSLTFLDCSLNLITSLPALSNSLQSLYCYTNSLTTLPALSNSLHTLYCYDNFLNTLPALPNSLQTLLCGTNSLTNLPALPNSLQSLDCSINYLHNLPALPNSLQILWCYDDSLTSLPALPNSLIDLECQNNNIACFPLFPNALNTCLIYSNPFICLPNYIPALGAYTTTPLCVPGNTNGCAFVGIKELSVGSNKVSIYPNPANDFLYLSSDMIEFTKASIINSLGQLVTETDLNYNNKNAIVNLKELPIGVYLLNLKGINSQTVSKRFVVER